MTSAQPTRIRLVLKTKDTHDTQKDTHSIPNININNYIPRQKTVGDYKREQAPLRMPPLRTFKDRMMFNHYLPSDCPMVASGQCKIKLRQITPTTIDPLFGENAGYGIASYWCPSCEYVWKTPTPYLPRDWTPTATDRKAYAPLYTSEVKHVKLGVESLS